MTSVFKYKNVTVRIIGGMIIFEDPIKGEIIFTFSPSTNDAKFYNCDENTKKMIQEIIDIFFKINVYLGRK